MSDTWVTHKQRSVCFEGLYVLAGKRAVEYEKRWLQQAVSQGG